MNWYVIIKDKSSNKILTSDFAGSREDAELLMSVCMGGVDKSERITMLPFNPLEIEA